MPGWWRRGGNVGGSVLMNTRLISAIDVVMNNLGRSREKTYQVGKGVFVFSNALPGKEQIQCLAQYFCFCRALLLSKSLHCSILGWCNICLLANQFHA